MDHELMVGLNFRTKKIFQGVKKQCVAQWLPARVFVNRSLQARFDPILSGFLFAAQGRQSWLPGLQLSANCLNRSKKYSWICKQIFEVEAVQMTNNKFVVR